LESGDQAHYGKPLDWEQKAHYYFKATEGTEIVGTLNLEILFGVQISKVLL